MWGFEALGYPEVLFNPQRIASALRHSHMHHWPVMAFLWCKLALQTLLLWTKYLNTCDFVFTTPTLSAVPLKTPAKTGIGLVRATLPDPSLLQWIDTRLPNLKRRGIRPMVSIEPHTPSEARYMLGLLVACRKDIFGVELSLRSPRAGGSTRANLDYQIAISIIQETLQTCTELCWQEAFLVLRLSIGHPWKDIIHWTANRFDAIELTESLPEQALHGGDAPFEGSVFEKTVAAVHQAIKLTRTPIIAGGNIRGRNDILRMSKAGAAAVSIGAGLWETPIRMSVLAHESRMQTVSP